MANRHTPPAPRRRSRAVRRIVITLVVLVGLLVVADFAAAAIFEHEVSKRAREEFGLSDDPSVDVHGFSFLLQAISGEYEQVDVKATGVPVKDLRDVEVEAELHGVQAPLGDLISGTATVQVREVKGKVRVKAGDVNRAISQNENNVVKTFTQLSIDPVSEAQVADPNAPAPKKPDPEDSTAGARICITADVLGQSVNPCVFGIISLGEQSIAFQPERLETRGLGNTKLPAQAQQALMELLAFTVPTGALPFQVTPTAVIVEQGALVVAGIAQNVTFGGGTG
ncbi:DUF2993 domain-containing protein [Actinophytocola sp.]|uniref:LmeA family phospholipid-binding protein n=1 Tax=Actinophytocola sp. TaxID=1872138 RepID=UPI002D7E77C9|nr:DUF2993 domain-containing protein [Actinophytocola sp.]HET9144380.1 DUF2993 domain-containing protein [Actinophytocola sp.]